MYACIIGALRGSATRLSSRLTRKSRAESLSCFDRGVREIVVCFADTEGRFETNETSVAG